ncbi:hypothetical protein I6A84_27270 [Frankia sp. CNm7]|uniref:Uncharacterized protein n=2 Tax=Frankia nepalensis TaxID=1836974 RepID=A0A937UJQ0_9ACTN|nr:hypothetical protein [Frankia nepalensis]MBL7510717.1 hypothetical protein [Frankia nepalensis]MBL7521680.1 hypothetical protein [Frankia nepalensis]MBL7626009.1 hypothetical protein [Frankia nepalensis]
MGTARPGMDIAELAAEQVELLPERMTLAIWEYDRQTFAPINYPVNSPGAENAAVVNTSETQTINGNGSVIQSIINSQSFIAQ